MKKLFQDNKLLLQAFLLISLNYLLTRYFYQVFPTEALYTNKSIFLNLYQYASLSLILFLTAPIVLYKLKWKEVFNENIIAIKYFVMFIFSIYAWGVITLDYNLYFNQPYHLDRIILVILFILSFRFPLAFIYFIILSLIFYNQVSYPSFDCLFPKVYINIKPLLEVSILLITFMFIKRVYKEVSILAFFIVVICFHAANYYIPGLAKILISEHYIDWIWVNDLGNILMAKYSQGWIAELVTLDTIQLVVGWMNDLNIPMQLFAFSIQVIVIFVFINKRFSLLLFFCFELLHLGIFIASGILFWRWVLLNLAIVYVITSVSKLNSNDIKKVFNYKVMLFSIPFIFLGNGFFHAYPLAWYDTPLNNFHKIYATTEDGKKHTIDVNLFAPYERVLYINTLNCFIEQPLKSRWDTTSQTIMEELADIAQETEVNSLKQEIYNFEQEYGQNEFDRNKQQKVKRFLKIFFKNLNNHKNKKSVWDYLSPVRHMYLSFDWDKPLTQPSNIKEIEIVFYKKIYSYKYNKLINLEEKSLVKIEIK